MCGVFAILSQPGTLEGRRAEAPLAALSHRGPDGKGVWVNSGRSACLAHARLAIIDPQGGAQPLFNEDRSVAAVVNGEFYDFEEIRKTLSGKGHKFSTLSDSEILIHLYEDLGTECLKHLRGEFAFVLWDEKRKQLFAARDRFGIKPLVYARKGGELLIASEAKALFAAGFEAGWDEQAFFQAAAFHYHPLEKTLFKGVKQLKAGHFLIAGGEQLDTRCYFDLDYPLDGASVAAPDKTAWLAAFKCLLEEAVHTRMRADVPVACYLSGGLDSSAVAGIAQSFSSAPLHCFTISFEQSAYDEKETAAETAKSLGARHHLIAVSGGDLLAALPDAVYAAEGLCINGHLPAKYLLSRAVRAAGIKVVLTGEGADELLAGYPHFAPPLSASLRAGNRDHASLGIMLPDEQGPALPLQDVQERLGFVPAFIQAKAGFGCRMQSFLIEDFKNSFARPYAAALSGLDAKQLEGRSELRKSLYIWNKFALTNYILRTLGDGTEMANSVEGRLPFLDHKLFELLRTAPDSLLVQSAQPEKALLREAAGPYLTAAVLNNRKHPFFSPPLLAAGGGSSLKLLQDIISGTSLPFIDRERTLTALSKLACACEREQKIFDPVVYMITSACLLHEKFGL